MTPSETAEILDRLADVVEAVPDKQWDMDIWLKENGCSVGCAIGHGIAAGVLPMLQLNTDLSGQYLFPVKAGDDAIANKRSFNDVADALGLTYGDAVVLFEAESYFDVRHYDEDDEEYSPTTQSMVADRLREYAAIYRRRT